MPPFLFSESGDVGGHVTLVTSDQVPITFRLDEAAGSPYVPADPLAWNVPPPDTTGEALDQLASLSRAGFAVSNVLSGASPRTFDTTVTPVKSGRFLVWLTGGGSLDGTGGRLQTSLQIRQAGLLVNNTRVEQEQQEFFPIEFTLSTKGLIVADRTASFQLGGQLAWEFGAIVNGYIRVQWWEL